MTPQVLSWVVSFYSREPRCECVLGHLYSEGVGALRVKPLPTPETGNGSSMGPSVASSKALGSDFERLVGTRAARSVRKKRTE